MVAVDGRPGARTQHLRHAPVSRDKTNMDPAMEEFKRNAIVLGAWLAAIRLAPYVCHAVQGAFGSK